MGNRERHIVDQKIYLPDGGGMHLDLAAGGAAETVIPSYYWFMVCAPQILGNFLHRASFREGKPLHELEYDIGFSPDDYPRVGYA